MNAETDHLDRRLGAGPADARGGPPAAVEAATVSAATDEGLVDVAWGMLDSPLGPLLVASTPRGLVRVSFEANDPASVLAVLARRISPRVVEAPALVDDARRQLDDYLAGRRQRFDLPVDWALVGPFGREVLTACAAIPYGQVSTYGALSATIGRPRASRATGNALGANPIPIVVPCHRVLRTGGGLGGYTGGLHLKEHLLALEGVLPTGGVGR